MVTIFAPKLILIVFLVFGFYLFQPPTLIFLALFSSWDLAGNTVTTHTHTHRVT